MERPPAWLPASSAGIVTSLRGGGAVMAAGGLGGAGGAGHPALTQARPRPGEHRRRARVAGEGPRRATAPALTGEAAAAWGQGALPAAPGGGSSADRR